MPHRPTITFQRTAERHSRSPEAGKTVIGALGAFLLLAAGGAWIFFQSGRTADNPASRVRSGTLEITEPGDLSVPAEQIPQGPVESSPAAESIFLPSQSGQGGGLSLASGPERRADAEPRQPAGWRGTTGAVPGTGRPVVRPQPEEPAGQPERATVLREAGPIPLTQPARDSREEARLEPVRPLPAQDQPQETAALVHPPSPPSGGEEPQTSRPENPPEPAKPAYTGPAEGVLIWTGNVSKGLEVTIDGNRASSGTVRGDPLPGVPCLVQVSHKNTAVAEAPGPRNRYRKVTLRFDTKGMMTITIPWQILE